MSKLISVLRTHHIFRAYEICNELQLNHNCFGKKISSAYHHLVKKICWSSSGTKPPSELPMLTSSKPPATQPRDTEVQSKIIVVRCQNFLNFSAMRIVRCA